ncbi:MAG: Uma2 family endonuclease [Planctomycetota bacterium]
MTATITKKKTTYADYVKIDDNNRYEVYNGELRMVPAPSTDHQFISRDLEILVWNFVSQKGLGEVLDAPVDVVFDDEEVYQPDLVFIKRDRQGIIKRDAIHGVPDLVMEIVSPSSVFYDTVEKKEIYRKYGVNEYWLVFPDEKAIEVFVLENGEYQEFCRFKKNGCVTSKILEGLKIYAKDIFK